MSARGARGWAFLQRPGRSSALAPVPPRRRLAPALALPESVRPGPRRRFPGPQQAPRGGRAATMQVPHKEHLYKLLVIGDLGVGKTSIIKRYVHQNFSSHYRATIGVDFALKVLHWDPETVVRLQLWDIAGEPRGRGLGRGHLADRLLCQGSGSRPRGDRVCLPGAAPRETFRGGLQTWFRRKQKVSP